MSERSGRRSTPQFRSTPSRFHFVFLLRSFLQQIRLRRNRLQGSQNRTRRKPRPPQPPIRACKLSLVLDPPTRRNRRHSSLDIRLNELRLAPFPERPLNCLFGQFSRNSPGAQITQHPHTPETLVLHPSRRETFRETPIVEISDILQSGQNRVHIRRIGCPKLQLRSEISGRKSPHPEALYRILKQLLMGKLSGSLFTWIHVWKKCTGNLWHYVCWRVQRSIL